MPPKGIANCRVAKTSERNFDDDRIQLTTLVFIDRTKIILL